MYDSGRCAAGNPLSYQRAYGVFALKNFKEKGRGEVKVFGGGGMITPVKLKNL